MKVTFVIIALNAEPVLKRSLECLKAQNYPHKNIEVVLIDGISTDRTKAIMLDFQQEETSFARVVVKNNSGKWLACGWNIALKEATGEIIIRVDAHTEFPCDFISKNVECVESGESICGGKVISKLENNSQMNHVMLEAENSMFGGGFTFFRRGEICKYTNTLAFAAYKKECFDTVGLYNERLKRTEDNEIHYRMHKAGYKFYFNPNIYSYRYCRNSFFKLLQQKYFNGYWVGLTMGVQPRAFSIFYFVPLLFVMGLIFFIVLAFFYFWPLVIYLFMYVLVLLASLALAIVKSKFYMALLLLPFILFSLHIAYGFGTINGLICIPKWLKNGQSSKDVVQNS